MIWSLRIGIALTCCALAAEQFIGDPPYRALLWDEAMLGPLVTTLTGDTWSAWATDPGTDALIQSIAGLMGTVLLMAGVSALLPLRGRWRWCWPALMLPPLLLIGLLRWADHAYQLAWPLEFAARLSLPLLLLAATDGPTRRQLLLLMTAIALTFVGHGLYALGVHPTPLAFHELLQRLLGLEGAAATAALHGIGLLDLIVALLLVWPRPRPWALAWMCLWGALTLLGRLAFLDPTFLTNTLPDVLIACGERLPHVLVPAACLVWLRTGPWREGETHAPDRPDPATAATAGTAGRG